MRRFHIGCPESRLDWLLLSVLLCDLGVFFGLACISDIVLLFIITIEIYISG